MKFTYFILTFFLDVPRSRLVKYPLLLKQVIKFSDDTDDIQLLNQAVTTLEKVNTKDFTYTETLTDIWKM